MFSKMKKAPVVMQMEALECGAASLCMVLAYYGRWVPLERMRIDCGVSRNGSNAKNMLIAARKHGMIAKAYRYEPEALKKSGSFPCIIHWNFNHFVVCLGFGHGCVYLNDPARGSIKVSMEEFDKAFTGVCLICKPGDEFQKEGTSTSVIKYACTRLKGQRAAVVLLSAILAITSLIGIINLGFSRVFMDRILSGFDAGWKVSFFIIMSIIAVIEIIVTSISAIYGLKISGKMAVIGNTSFMWKILRMPMEFFSQRMAGDIQLRQKSNENIAKQMVEIVAPLAVNIVMMIFYAVIMFRYNVVMALIGVSSIAINVCITNYISKKKTNITRVMMRDCGKLAAATVNGIEMIESIKSSGCENGYFEKWSGYQASVNTQQVHFEKVNQYLGIIPMAVTKLSSVIVLIAGVYYTVNGNMTVGMIMAFGGFLSSFMTPAMTILEAGEDIQQMRTQMERIEDVMKYPSDSLLEKDMEDSSDDENTGYNKLTGNIEIKNLTFGYSKLDKPLIENFNLTIKQGQKIAFVGTSGCGKSTLSKLISGLYKPWDGKILFDGKSIEEIDRNVFTGSIAVVDQDIILFEDTIANNISMWDETIEDYEIIMAARDAQLHEDIIQRDGGYNYRIKDGGKDFSGGQRQRMEIARVLAQDPTTIILDEATSALDAKTEYEVVKSIKNRGITCIVVAHRLSTIRDCDEIIVMDKGKIVERGTHEELMKKGGFYTELVTSD